MLIAVVHQFARTALGNTFANVPKVGMVVGGVLAGELVKNASVVAWCVRQ